MTFWSESRRLFKKVDKFSTIELLRYKQQTQYATYTGACLSVVLVALIVLLAGSLIIQTANKERINSSISVTVDSVAQNTTFQLDQFRFGVQIAGLNLNNQTISYFDIVVSEQIQTRDGDTERSFETTACEEEQWAQPKQIQETFDHNDGQQWLCINEHQNTTLGGNAASPLSQIFRIDVFSCASHFTDKDNCATEEQMDALFEDNDGSLEMVIYSINSLVQPSEDQPLLKFLDDSRRMVFSRQIGQLLVAEAAEYNIETDNSLMPWKDIERQSGSIIVNSQNTYAREVRTDWFSAFELRKSKVTYNYSRSFYKIDELISYIGGLIALSVSVFIWFLPYTQLCYEFSLCNQIFVDKDGNPLQLSFNFLRYIIYEIYYGITYFCRCCKIDEYEQYKQCSDQIQKELDVVYLFKRINCLERIVTQSTPGLLMQNYPYRKMTFEESQKNRERVCTPTQALNKNNQEIPALNSHQQLAISGSLEENINKIPLVTHDNFIQRVQNQDIIIEPPLEKNKVKKQDKKQYNSGNQESERPVIQNKQNGKHRL